MFHQIASRAPERKFAPDLRGGTGHGKLAV
jgi:hypothetical protein